MRNSSYVLSYIGSDDPLRGDSQAVKGLGRSFADKTGRDWHYLDDARIAELYPDLNRDDAYDRFFTDQGEAEIVLTNSRNLSERDFPSSYLINGNNEELAQLYNPDLPSLVPHHHTEASLAQAGQKFAQSFPGLAGPLIALMHIQTGLRHFDLAERVVTMLKAEGHEKATIFICGTRRTPVTAQNDLLTALRHEIRKSGFADGIAVKNYLLGPEFNRSEDFNPYAGLIASADHFILAGESKSIVSECLFSGKTVMTFNTAYRDLESHGFTHNLRHHDAEQGFPTRSLPALNITDLIVDGMIAKYELQTMRSAQRVTSQFDTLRPL